DLARGGGAGEPTSKCAVLEEICDGLDNNCDDAPDEGDTCPPGCSGSTFLDLPYMFCTQPGDRAEAAAQCAASGMALVRIDSLEENAFLFETMKDLVVGTQTEMYIGGTDAADEGHWLWSDGTEFWNGDANGMAVDGAFEHWADGAPSNQSDNYQPENCAIIRLDNAEGAWGDVTCYEELPFACELPP
ncbi:MAG TPA: C-type lectin domain-containing protein, partial [Polyangiaceae bacterium]|nr:C-type lectin domain-containing protein [Polyangiaceae bacterium]